MTKCWEQAVDQEAALHWLAKIIKKFCHFGWVFCLLVLLLETLLKVRRRRARAVSQAASMQPRESKGRKSPGAHRASEAALHTWQILSRRTAAAFTAVK